MILMNVSEETASNESHTLTGRRDLEVNDGAAGIELALRQQLRDAEERLAGKIEELAKLDRDLEQFVSVAAHDLQEPLRMVVAYTQLLDQRYRGQLDENAAQFMGYAVEGALRMQGLLQDLLTFSRLSGLIHRANTDCKSVVDEALQNLGRLVAQSGAVITCGSLPSVHADRSRLLQLFQNLIDNAIKFRGERPPVITISGERKEDMAVFAVSDNGIGIASDQMEIIFVIFQRLHSREEYAGNGVGLAICKRIVERHGGRIWVESRLGGGSTFRFGLPSDFDDENRGDRHEFHA